MVLLSQLLVVPFQQPLLGHMVAQCKQEPPQSVSAIQMLGLLLHNHPPDLNLGETALKSDIKYIRWLKLGYHWWWRLPPSD